MVTGSVAAAAVIRCAFYARRPQPGGKATYDAISVASYFHDGNLATLHPPMAGDQVLLWDQADGKWVSYRVLKRQWRPVEYGSYAWPHNQQVAPAGDHLDIVVEVCEGLFGDEADDDEPAAVTEQVVANEILYVHHQVGLGGDGRDRSIPLCPVCWARGGGGHGGFCPNTGKGNDERFWIMSPPAGFLRPPYPENRVKW